MISGDVKDEKYHSLDVWSACSGRMVTVHFLACIQLILITQKV